MNKEAQNNVKSERNAATDDSPVPSETVPVPKDPEIIGKVPEQQVPIFQAPETNVSREVLLVKTGFDSLLTTFGVTPIEKRRFYALTAKIGSFENTPKSFLIERLRLLFDLLQKYDYLRISPGKDVHPLDPTKKITRLSGIGYSNVVSDVMSAPDSVRGGLIGLVQNMVSVDNVDITREDAAVFALPEEVDLMQFLHDLKARKMSDVHRFWSFIRNLSTHGYQLRPEIETDPRFTKMMLAGDFQTLHRLVTDNQFMREPYYTFVQRMVGSAVQIPVDPAAQDFQALLKSLKVGTTSFSLVSQLPSELVSGQALLAEIALMAATMTNGSTMISGDMDVLSMSPSMIIAALVSKLYIESGVIDYEFQNKIDNFLLRHFVSKLVGYRHQFEVWNDAEAKLGRRNFLTESIDAGALAGPGFAAYRDFLYTPAGPNPGGNGWAEGGQVDLPPIPTDDTGRTAGLINANARSIHFRPTVGVVATSADCTTLQFDNFVAMVRMMGTQRTPFTYSGNEADVGRAVQTVLNYLIRLGDSFKARAFRLDSYKRSFGVSSLFFPQSNVERNNTSNLNFHKVQVPLMAFVTSLLLSNYRDAVEPDPTMALKYINLGYAVNDNADRLCEVYHLIKPQMPSQDGWTKSEVWNEVFRIHGGDLGPLLVSFKDALMNGAAQNMDIASIPNPVLSDENSLSVKAAAVLSKLFEPLALKFGLSREFYLGTVPMNNGLFRRYFRPFNDNTIEEYDRIGLNNLKTMQQARQALFAALRNQKSIRFRIPIRVEDIVTDGLIDQPKALLAFVGDKGVQVGVLKQYLTFADMIVFDNSNTRVYEEDPVWSVGDFTFFNEDEVSLYTRCANKMTVLKDTVRIISTTDASLSFERVL